MAISAPQYLVPGQLLTGSAAVYYTVPANKRTQINQATLKNTDDVASIAATVYLVTSGGSANDAAEIFEYTLAAKESVLVSEIVGHTIHAGDTIQAFAGTASKISIRVSGTEFTI